MFGCPLLSVPFHKHIFPHIITFFCFSPPIILPSRASHLELGLLQQVGHRRAVVEVEVCDECNVNLKGEGGRGGRQVREKGGGMQFPR